MIEIAVYGRGGQGVVVASHILAHAYFLAGYEVQAFPMFGPERRGTPVQAYIRVDAKPVRKRCHISDPAEVILLHADTEILKSLNPQLVVADAGVVLPKTWGDKREVWVCDGMTIASKCHLGNELVSVPNTALLGAYCRATGRLKKKTLYEAIGEILHKHVKDNIKACRMGYQKVRKIGK
ncbi:MAG TPA: pyruvate ferredoxin oxidoreductase [Syntrophaceae bacterium]|nr:pyruvate ferredoxin oxidoreductase [Syntrophaceae bacterium]